MDFFFTIRLRTPLERVKTTLKLFEYLDIYCTPLRIDLPDDASSSKTDLFSD
jgi:hypothetical protein